MGSVARYANHHCDPNCMIDEWLTQDGPVIVLVAIRNIGKEEELTFSYAKDQGFDCCCDIHSAARLLNVVAPKVLEIMNKSPTREVPKEKEDDLLSLTLDSHLEDNSVEKDDDLSSLTSLNSDEFVKKSDYCIDSESQTHDIPTHSNERRYYCLWLDCNKSFRRRFHLIRHQTTVHSNERPYPCQYLNCGETFKSKEILDNHQAVHSNERRYSCQYLNCGSKFKRLSEVKLHQEETHSNEKRYSCQCCGDLFKRERSLKRHKKESCKAQGKRKRPGAYKETDKKKRKLRGAEEEEEEAPWDLQENGPRVTNA